VANRSFSFTYYRDETDLVYLVEVFYLNLMLSAELDKVTEQIVSKLREGYAPNKIVLFGSHVRGDATSDSDIDLLIIKETNLRFIDRWVTVRTILSDSSRKFAIDTLILTPREIEERLSRGDQFIADILQNGQVLYAA
jgi:predicted nucleotidyltransferase